MTPERNQSEAFSLKVDPKNNNVIVEINRGIIGPLANQLRSTGSSRKGASIIRKLGILLAQAGDILYSDEGKAKELMDKHKIENVTGDKTNETI